jgi:hypothetical protein
MKYDKSLAHRRLLGVELLAMLDEAGFERIERKGTAEAIFAREIPDTGIRVLVYSGCNPTKAGMTARSCGSDAIRVCAVYQGTDRERGIVSAKRVHRTGHIEAIVKRTLSRMREVWSAAAHVGHCSDCGAPLFESKRGNLVCADVCWTRRAA